MIRQRLSREAEVRLLKLAVKGRPCYKDYPIVTHIDERHFDDWMANRMGTPLRSDRLGGLYGLGLDRVVVEIDGIAIYDNTAPAYPAGSGGCCSREPMVKTYTRMEKAEPEPDSREPTRCTWIDICGRKSMVLHFEHRNHVQFWVPEGIPLATILMQLRATGMPSDEHKARHMIMEGQVLLDGEAFTDPDLVLGHNYEGAVSLREWDEGRSISIDIIYGEHGK